MTDATVLDVTQKALVLAITISAPILGAGLIVGLMVSVFQAATQIHEMSLTFIPKILAVAISVAILGPWMLRQMLTFTSGLLESIPSLVK